MIVNHRLSYVKIHMDVEVAPRSVLGHPPMRTRDSGNPPMRTQTTLHAWYMSPYTSHFWILQRSHSESRAISHSQLIF